MYRKFDLFVSNPGPNEKMIFDNPFQYIIELQFHNPFNGR